MKEYKIKKILMNFFNQTQADYYDYIKKVIKSHDKKMIITANPEFVIKSQNDEEIKKMLNDPLISIVPDGVGIVKAGKALGVNFKERITGVDLANFLIGYANEKKLSLALFGSTEEVIFLIKKKIAENYNNINLVLATNGYVQNKKAVINKMIKLEPDIVLVALGMPLQEKIIYENYLKFKKGIFVGVGGSLDVLSGLKRRAPKFFIKTNTEWLYRIIKEPKRLKKFFNNNIKFMFSVYAEKMRGNK